MANVEEDIVARIRKHVHAGTDIPKPYTDEPHRVKGWGKRRKESALIYRIPNHKNPMKPHEKGITESEWRVAWERLFKAGQFSRNWFELNMPACNKEGGCNFTTIGGIFVLLGDATYEVSRYLRLN